MFGALTAIVLLTCGVIHAAPSATRQSFDIQVPWVPQPAVLGDKTELVYELQLTNFSEDALQLESVDALDTATGTSLGHFDGKTLDAAVGQVQSVPAKRSIASGAHATIYLSLPAPRGGVAVKHRIEYSVAGTMQRFTVEGGRFTPRPANPVALGPPLRGGPWVAIYDASWERGHRRVLYAVDGTLHLPGRFAIDWIKVDDKGAHAGGDGSKPASWFGYGADVLAVADATVAATRDNVTEPSVVAHGPSRVPIGDATGNYVALALGDGRFVFFEHLKPGSVRVRPGQHVRRGDVIGKLGFTGQSTGPHLHMHVADASAPLAAEGLPYAMEGFHVEGNFPSIEAFGVDQVWLHDAAPRRTPGMPGPLEVVTFTP
jgi:murein DD-endopeptidase MepM/ murein hydrolase activator NlpD